MKEKTKWNDYDALPLILDVTDIQHIMGISRASAYELVHTPGFPAVRSGRLIKISKKAFFNWLDSGGNSHENKKGRRNHEFEYSRKENSLCLCLSQSPQHRDKAQMADRIDC